MPVLLQLQNLPWKGDGGWTKSVFASFWGWSVDREFVEEKKERKKKKKKEKKKKWNESLCDSQIKFVRK